jgi:hypothetical protein
VITWTLTLFFMLNGVPINTVATMSLPSEAACMNSITVAKAVANVVRSKGIELDFSVRGTCTQEVMS